MEIRKAINSLAPGKAPGPEGLPADVFRHLLALTGLSDMLCSNIFLSGMFLVDLLRIIF